MTIFLFSLIFIPIIIGIMCLVYCNKTFYKILSYIAFLLCTALAVTVVANGKHAITIGGNTAILLQCAVTLLEVIILSFIFYMSFKHKKWLVFILNSVQTVLFIYTAIKEFSEVSSAKVQLNVDFLSMMMLLIINIVGTLILVFANGYITQYEEHRHLKSRQRLFYPVICIFLAAMNGLVISDSLSYVFFFWEITTICSFILISYNHDKEAYTSGFRALFMNIIGGICFSIGNILLSNLLNISTLSGIISKGKLTGIYMIPVFLLCIAGFSKSAQMPFHSWLLSAMVAPTPVSALLHSSTMVKAGVYLIVKLSPAYAGTSTGTAIAIYGGITFLIASAAAVTERNAKRVLAYSTIANLGLIISSAGMGSGICIAAAIILIMFHAVSKALLFLCAGQIEHTIGSRDIEDMMGLVHKAPLLCFITVFGLISMILPPFGVLVTKLISIEASSINPWIVILLVLGSALTTLYYVKWIGTLLSYPETTLKKKFKYDFNIYFPLCTLSLLAIITSLLVSPIYNKFVAPEVKLLLKISNVGLSIVRTNISSSIGYLNNEFVFFIIGIVIIILLLLKIPIVNKTDVKKIYMCGENNTDGDDNSFRTTNGVTDHAKVGNFYLSYILDSKILLTLGYIVSISIILIVLLGGLV